MMNSALDSAMQKYFLTTHTPPAKLPVTDDVTSMEPEMSSPSSTDRKCDLSLMTFTDGAFIVTGNGYPEIETSLNAL